MPHSTVVSTGTGISHGWATSDLTLSSNMPAGVVAGNALLMVLVTDPASNLPVPAGWQSAISAPLVGNAKKLYAFKRPASGDAADIPTLLRSDQGSGAQGCSVGGLIQQLAKPSGAMDMADIEAVANATFGPADPPSVTTSWPAGDNLVLAFGTSATIGTTAQTNYSGLINSPDSGVSDILYRSQRDVTTQTENPGAFVNSQGFGFGLTVMVRGSAPPADTTPPNITSTGTGATNGPFAASIPENSTGVAMTLTSNEDLGTVTKSGADSSRFTVTKTGLRTVTIAPSPFLDFDNLPHANPFTLFVDLPDLAAIPNVTTVEINFTITDLPDTPPSVTQHPASQSKQPGEDVTFTSTANGAPAPTGQWQVNTGGGFVDIVGQTADSYTKTGLILGDSGSTYRRAYANGFGGTVYSNIAILTVAVPGTAPSITTQPVAAAVAEGATATFNVVADGTAPLAYQWQTQPAGGGGYTNVSGANSASYARVGVSAGDNGRTVRCVVSNAQGSVTTNAVAIGVSTPPTTYGCTAQAIYFTTGTAIPQQGKAVNWSLFVGQQTGALGLGNLYQGSATTGLDGRFSISGIPQSGAAELWVRDADGGRYFENVTLS